MGSNEWILYIDQSLPPPPASKIQCFLSSYTGFNPFTLRREDEIHKSIFLIRNEEEKERRGEMIPEIKKILYATDLSKNSSYAFLYAADMARRHNARIIILHSVEPVRHMYAEGVSDRLEEILQKAKRGEREADVEEIKKYLQEFCKKIENQVGPPCGELVAKILVPLGHPVEQILKAADEEGCDAFVLGTHGKGFLRHTFLGSVAEDVLERTRKPVFIIPLPSEKTNFDWDHI
jgi:nucleotide-binding universal stress UspA family protein